MTASLPDRPLRDFFAFLASPVPLRPTGLAMPGAWRVWATLLGFHLVVLLAVLAPALRMWQLAFALPSPDAFGKLHGIALPLLVVIAAPMGEEIAFRGWLTGRPRALWLLLCGLIAAVLLALVSHHVREAAASLGFVAAAAAGLAGWLAWRKRTAVPAWFGVAFPMLFWLSAPVFGLSHLVNYPSITPALLPMILPQAWAGLLLGYTRLRLGLPASMLLHGCANGTALAIAMALS